MPHTYIYQALVIFNMLQFCIFSAKITTKCQIDINKTEKLCKILFYWSYNPMEWPDKSQRGKKWLFGGVSTKELLLHIFFLPQKSFSLLASSRQMHNNISLKYGNSSTYTTFQNPESEKLVTMAPMGGSLCTHLG